jgi:hypothetical protein
VRANLWAGINIATQIRILKYVVNVKICWENIKVSFKVIFLLQFQWPRGLRRRFLYSLACWGCVFETLRGHECLSLVSVVCCQVEGYESGRSFAQRSPTECCVSQCDRENSVMRVPGSLEAVALLEKNIILSKLLKNGMEVEEYAFIFRFHGDQ